jgi:hypothetical protein
MGWQAVLFLWLARTSAHFLMHSAGSAQLSSRALPACAPAGVIGFACRPSAFMARVGSAQPLTETRREHVVRVRPSQRPCPTRSLPRAPCLLAPSGSTRAVVITDSHEISQTVDDIVLAKNKVDGAKSHRILAATGRAGGCSARVFSGRTRFVMAASSSRNFLPSVWSVLAGKMPDDIRIIVESLFEEKLEYKKELLALKDKLLEEKDKWLDKNEELLAMLEVALNDLKVQRLQELGQYQVVYELRDTFDWLLRSLYCTPMTSQG